MYLCIYLYTYSLCIHLLIYVFATYLFAADESPSRPVPLRCGKYLLYTPYFIHLGIYSVEYVCIHLPCMHVLYSTLLYSTLLYPRIPPIVSRWCVVLPTNPQAPKLSSHQAGRQVRKVHTCLMSITASISIFSFQFSVFSFQFSVFSFQFSVFSFSIFTIPT